MKLNLQGFYFISDDNLSLSGVTADVKAAVNAGVCAVQYRSKTADTLTMVEQGARLRQICRHTLLLINDRVDVALTVNACGVHLGSQDLPYQSARRLLGKKRIIGMTVRNLAQALEAQELGADYIGVAPIFATKTKFDANHPCGIEVLRQISARIKIPIVAVGGISLDNAAQVVAAGADAICAISAVVTKKNVSAQIKKFKSGEKL
jgi:thiamine-phosphate pyrophosphorylase